MVSQLFFVFYDLSIFKAMRASCFIGCPSVWVCLMLPNDYIQVVLFFFLARYTTEVMCPPSHIISRITGCCLFHYWRWWLWSFGQGPIQIWLGNINKRVLCWENLEPAAFCLPSMLSAFIFCILQNPENSQARAQAHMWDWFTSESWEEESWAEGSHSAEKVAPETFGLGEEVVQQGPAKRCPVH